MLNANLDNWILRDTRKNIFDLTLLRSSSVLMRRDRPEYNLRSGSIFVSLGETFRRDGRNEK